MSWTASPLRLTALFFCSIFSASHCDAVLIETLTGESRGEFFEWHVFDPVVLGGPENLVGFTLQVHGNDARFLPNAFDGISVVGEPDAPDRAGISGRLHQEQIQVLPGVVIPSPDLETSSSSIYDTHFLHSEDEVLAIGTPFIEDSADDATSGEPGEFLDLTVTGFTGRLTGIFGVIGRPTELVWDLAYVVVPFDSVVTIDATVAGFNPDTEDAMEELFTFTFDVNPDVETVVPEPLSGFLTAAAVAALGWSMTKRPRYVDPESAQCSMSTR